MPRDWSAHDSNIPFYDPRLAKLNGTNPRGRRPHALIEPERLRLPRAENDDADSKEEAA
jgi:hypothetical protein